MATISNNTKGNPYHDDEGKFTSQGDQGTKKEEIKQGEMPSLMKNELPTPIQQNIVPKSKLKLKANVNIEELKQKVEELKQISNIPYLRSAQDVINYFPKFFVKGLVEDLDKYYGKTDGSRPYLIAPFTFRDGRRGLKINLFAYLLGKHRYKEKGSQAISLEEYNYLKSIIDTQGSGKFNQYRDRNGREVYGDDTQTLAMSNDIGCGMVLGYRGIPVSGNDAYDIGQNYVGEGSVPATYGEQGCYGTVHYVAMSQRYAQNYAYSHGHVYKHIIDVKNSNVLYQHELDSVARNLRNHASQLQQVAEQHFSKFVSPDRARELAQGFVGSINYDVGFISIMLGADVLICGMGNGNQIDVLNFGKAKILRDW